MNLWPKAVEALAKLRGAGGGFKLVRVRAETKIAAIAEYHRMIGVERRGNLGAGQARGEINPVVNIQDGMADAELGGGEILKAIENDFLDVSRLRRRRCP